MDQKRSGYVSKKKTESLDISEIRKFHEELRNDPVRLQALIRHVMGPPKRVLEGKELELVWLMIQLRDEPDEWSNNQHSISEVYKMNQKEYHVHYFEDETIVEEILHNE